MFMYYFAIGKGGGNRDKMEDLYTSDKNASSDSPPIAFSSAASSYGVPFQGLQYKNK